MNYTVYHCHTENSLLDSCTNYKLYVDRAVQLGQCAIAFTEHGNIYNWVEKKMYCDSKGIKYIHGIEVYLTETLEEKVRDNFHTILLAKNYEGVKEINKLFGLSHNADHFYYKPRITFDEFCNISNNVIATSACLQSPLNYWRLHNKEFDKDRRAIYLRVAKRYDYLEIQYHNISDQKEFNRFLYELSGKIDTPLIVGTDTHSIDSYKAECRTILQYGKEIVFSNEDEFDLTYKTYDELVIAFENQNALPKDVVLEAIENTNRMANDIENFELDLSFKYPILYGDNDEAVLKETIKNKLKDKLDKNIISKDDMPKYKDNIQEELQVFKEIGMTGFMLFMSELITWCWDNGIPVGFCRGSVGGSTIAYITDIIDVNPIVWNTIFSRFANKDRKEIGDIDIDVSPSQRQLVFDYIINRFGKDKTAHVLSMGTVQSKGCIDLIGKGLKIKWEREGAVGDNPYPLDKVKRIKDEFEADEVSAREKYSELFYYYDGLSNTIVSQSMHPAGIIASPISLDEHYGCFEDGEGHKILSINMEEAHEVSLVKYDILGLQNIEIIKDTCTLANIPYPKSHEIDWDDTNVWEDMIKYPTGIFQFEGDYAFECLKKMNPHKLNDMSLTNAALRPSGESYREDLFAGKIHKNPSVEIDELLKDNRGFLIFQEDVIKFLKDICGLSGGEADNVRRAIGRKQMDRLQKALPQILEGYCSVSSKPREVAEEEAKEFLQIIEDSSNYMFGYNHSTGYSMIGYTCAMLRYYYPLEFCTAYLNNARNDEDISKGTILAQSLGFKIKSVEFGKSSSGYSFDKDNDTIYQGMSSIKYMNDVVPSELLDLSKQELHDFIDVLVALKDTSVNSRQLDILIRLNFFAKFGKNKYLLTLVELYNKLGKCKTIKKDKLYRPELFGLTESQIREFAGKETAKQFGDIDNLGLIRSLAKHIKNEPLSLKEQVEAQYEYLGYCNFASDKVPEYYWLVVEFKTYKDKNRPYVTLHNLHSGDEVKTRIKYNKTFKANPFEKFDVLCFEKLANSPKVRKDSDGNWVETGEIEQILNVYEVVKR